MEEYLKMLLEQIRCKKARPYICQEIKNHLEDQIAANIGDGMDYESAEKEAVKDMGDPVEVGISLDRIHKPQIAWKMLLLIGVISVVGIVIHWLINMQVEGIDAYASGKYAIHVALGIIVMMVLYCIDYTVLARFSKLIAGVLLASCIYTMFFGIQINGMRAWTMIAGVPVMSQAIMLLYIPIYGGVIYKYRGLGYKGLFKAIVWLILPVILVFRIPSLTNACLLLISMLVMLTIAIQKGWFKIKKRTAIVGVWTGFVSLPIIGLVGIYFGNILAEYQKVRIQAFISNHGDTNYLTDTVRSFLKTNRMIGGSGADISGLLPGFNTDYILSYLSSTYGTIVAILICCMLAALIVMIWGTALKQKNQLGMLMGSGCGMVFLVSFVINVLENLGVFPPTMTFLPFFSAGGSYIVVSYGMLGIVLSIYRYKNIYPKHINTNAPRIKMIKEL